jgi:energy-coupling factor transport system substrate-specific component
MGDIVEKSKTKKLTVKDLIFAGAFAAIYLIAVLAIMMLVGSVPILYVMCPGILGVLLGSIYLLSVTKVRKFGTALIIELLFACISTGFDPIAFTVCVVSALLAEICILIGRYKSKLWYAISYVFFNIGTAANFIRIFFAKDAYIENLQKRAGGSFADGMVKLLSPWWSWIMIIGLAVVGGIIGAFIGSKLIKKHFEKAEIV